MSDENKNPDQYSFQGAVRMVWVYVVKAKDRTKLFGADAEDRFEVTFLIPKVTDDEDLKKDLAAVREITGRVAKTAFGGAAGVSFPIKDGDKYADEQKAKKKDAEWARGHLLLTTHSKADQPPYLWRLDAGKYVTFENRADADKYFYPGCMAVPTVKFKDWAVGGNKVCAYINEVLSLNAGEKMIADRDPSERYGSPEKYDKYRGRVSSEDPTKGMEDDDEIPF
jgi:hypothetical protein